MPIPSPGTYDVASQATLVAVKAKTDIIGATVALEAAGNLAAVKAKTDALPANTESILGLSRLAVVNGSSALAANTRKTITITPPVGEVWQVTVNAAIPIDSASRCVIIIRTVSQAGSGQLFPVISDAGYWQQGLMTTLIVSDLDPLVIEAVTPSAVFTLYYQYFGVKI